MSIYDLVVSQELVAYWEVLVQNEAPYVGEEIFPSDKKLGLDLKWIKGSQGAPIVLKTSGFDVAAIPRTRIGFEKLSSSMPFFKESLYVDEEMRQELNKVIETGNKLYIDAIINRIFADEVALLRGARASRERMRMMALTTGYVVMTNNGQTFLYDYGVPSSHKVTVTTAWSDLTNSKPIEDIRAQLDLIETETGIRPRRAMCSRTVWGYLLGNLRIKKSINGLSDGETYISDAKLAQYLLDNLDIEVVINDKRYVDEAGVNQRFIAEDIFVAFPDTDCGKTWFGTTPEESDLMSGQAANVTITDVGVAVTTMQKVDPVTVETKVTMICLPSFELADSVSIMDVA